MALTTQNAGGMVAGPATPAPSPIVQVRLLRAIRHEGRHTEAGTVLEVTRAHAIDLAHMGKAELLPALVVSAEAAPARQHIGNATDPAPAPAARGSRRAAPQATAQP